MQTQHETDMTHRHYVVHHIHIPVLRRSCCKNRMIMSNTPYDPSPEYPELSRFCCMNVLMTHASGKSGVNSCRYVRMSVVCACDRVVACSSSGNHRSMDIPVHPSRSRMRLISLNTCILVERNRSLDFLRPPISFCQSGREHGDQHNV